MNVSNDLYFKGLKAAVASHRRRLGATAAEELPYATSQARLAFLQIVVDDDDARWDFMRDGEVLLSFWPARRHARKKIGPEFLCRNWQHAIVEALRVHKLLHRQAPDRRDLD